jgi:hypothetical protein
MFQSESAQRSKDTGPLVINGTDLISSAATSRTPLLAISVRPSLDPVARFA